MFVPVDYRYPDPWRYPDITDEDIQLFHDYILQQNPVQTVDIQIRDEPMIYNQQISNLGALLNPTRQLKIQDGAAANVYYHSLVDVGGPSVNMVAGIANFANASMNESEFRVAATVYYKHYDPGDEETGEEPQTLPAEQQRADLRPRGWPQPGPRPRLLSRRKLGRRRSQLSLHGRQDRRLWLRDPRLPHVHAQRRSRLHELLRQLVGLGLDVEQDLQPDPDSDLVGLRHPAGSEPDDRGPGWDALSRRQRGLVGVREPGTDAWGREPEARILARR